MFTQRAVKVIDSHDNKNPMFLVVSYTAPHSPRKPLEEIVRNRNQHITDQETREYAAMVTQLDDGVGAISDALSRNNMWNNTVFLFMSDHGASVIPNICMDTVGGSNFPFRDGKGSYFEGGIKGAAFVSTPWLSAEQRGMRSPALLHAVDVYSFIIAAAEDKLSVLRRRMKTVIQLIVTSILVTTSSMFYITIILEGDKEAHMLFDLKSDPYETTNVASNNPEIVKNMIDTIKDYKKDALNTWM
ncbi:hypothetical protein ACHWQZ_G014541 [Mnemiopsis leidyi]